MRAKGGTGHGDFESETFIVAGTLTGAGAIASDPTQITQPTNRSNPRPGDPVHTLAAAAHPPAIAFSCKDYGQDQGLDVAPTLRAMNETAGNANAGGQLAVAFNARQDPDLTGDLSGPLDTDGASIALQTAWAVRRLTPRECERLQGVADDHTLVPYRGGPMKDGPRYKMIGNSFAVAVVAYIGERVEIVRRTLAAAS